MGSIRSLDSPPQLHELRSLPHTRRNLAGLQEQLRVGLPYPKQGGLSTQMLRLLLALPHSVSSMLAARLLYTSRKLEVPFLGILSNHKKKSKATDIEVHQKAAQIQSPYGAQS